MVQVSGLRVGLWICALFVLIGASDLGAPSDGKGAKDEAAVRQAGKDYRAAIERGDNKAIADFWTADGTYTDQTGRTAKVRDLVIKEDGSKASTAWRSSSTKATVRLVTDSVAIEEGEFTAPAVDGGPQGQGRCTAPRVRDGGRWKLDTVREAQLDLVANADQLDSLSIFVGDWSGEVNKISIRVSAKWDSNKKFLRREITLASGNASQRGTQF